jgi:hypothetical protein
VRSGVVLFLWAVIVTVIEKYIAIVVAGGAEGAKIARSTILDYMKLRTERKLPAELDMAVIVREFVKPLFRPAMWIAWRSIKKTTHGDINAGLRQLMVWGQIQGLLLFVEIILFISAIGQLIKALPK